VRSFGTEGRRPGEELPPGNEPFDYIVFRGSDVKDLRIEEGPREPEPRKPQMPDDPAILGVSRKHILVTLCSTYIDPTDEAFRM